MIIISITYIMVYKHMTLVDSCPTLPLRKEEGKPPPPSTPAMPYSQWLEGIWGSFVGKGDWKKAISYQIYD